MKARRDGGVQSVERAFRLLELLAEAGHGRSLTELVGLIDLPAPTVHRLLKTMTGLGYTRQLADRSYGLGLGLLRLRPSLSDLAERAAAVLRTLAEQTGESANLAVLDGAQVMYVAQAPSRHPMRMFTEVGQRAALHSTGVGKAILSELDPGAVRTIVERAGLAPATTSTLTDLAALQADLELIKRQGYAIDDGEQALGVRCFAVALPGLPVPMAVSVSGPDIRVTHEFAGVCVPLLQAAVDPLTVALGPAFE